LSQKVILVEGPTEKAFFSFLFNNPQGVFFDNSGTAKVTVIDTVGKYHFFKFAKLLRFFGIKTWCIYDTDNNACSNGISHQKLNDALCKLKTDGDIEDLFAFDPSLEVSLGVTKDHNTPDTSMYINLENNVNNCITSKAYTDIVAFTKKILDQ
jgi:predicted ATP-dependent endonuclease of OLD family